ncbi:unnamed protein product, partial [Coregonus sp. 'balchen']
SVVFTSREIFTPDLSNTSSQAFQNRTRLIITLLEPFYRSAFPSFISLTVIKFSSGSIINTVNLAFNSSSVPNTKEIGNVLINAARNDTAFNIDPTSLEPFYRSAFPSFNSLTVKKFSSGSIINTMTLAFRSSSVPNSKEIGTVLINAARNITAFDIDPTSVTVDGTAVTSSGVSGKTSLFTAIFLVVLSLLLSSQH